MNRKDEHVSLAKAFHKPRSNDFDAVRIVHQSLPQIDMSQVSLETEFLDQLHPSPFFINAMTGGSDKTREINRQLAEVAKAGKLMMATGSASVALKDSSVIDSFKIVRKTYPDGFIVANVGAGQSVEAAQRIVDLVEANALQIHLNAPQELVMPEGDRGFSTWLQDIEAIIQQVSVPVCVKEVGFGMSRETIRQLLDVGVQTIDVSGNGGTSFTQIENARRKKREYDYLSDFGQSTVISLLEANEVPHPFERIASGGIRNALDIFKSLCLGAKGVGVSSTLLTLLLSKGTEETIQQVLRWQEELRTLYTMCGSPSTKELKKVPLVFNGEVQNWCISRQINLQKYSLR